MLSRVYRTKKREDGKEAWDPDGSGLDRRQAPDGAQEVYEYRQVNQPYNSYPWFPLQDNQVVHFEVRCAVCHDGLCGRSEGVKIRNYQVPCVFVPVCQKCLNKARKHPEWEPNEHLAYPAHNSSKYD